jgi:dienelactone hydrolase
MKQRGLILLLILSIVIFLHPQKDNAPRWEELVSIAKEFVSALVNGRYDDSVKYFDETMTKLAPPEKMEEVWKSIVQQVGPFKEVKGVWTESLPKYDIVYVTCQFEKALLDVKVVFDQNKKIAGQFFVPPKSSKEFHPPEYVDEDLFSEKEVTLGVPGWQLPGILSIPEGSGPFPALVLVHGSGPNDRDESLGPNKPFRDLAWGLASQNIAVLRYDKRTKVHGRKMTAEKGIKFTVYEETIEDALAAADLLRMTDEIDGRNVFILGHSLGGMLIPRIAKEDEKSAGFIIMAGPTRPLEELIVEQVLYISLLDGKISEEEKANLDKLKKLVDDIRSLTLSNASETKGQILGAGPYYWLDLKDYDPAEEAKSLNRPLLILQGGRDYQVTGEDFKGWKKSLSDKSNVEFKSYPDLNHLLIPGKGKCSPAEYQRVGHVNHMVIDDIVEWIKKAKK